MLTLEQRLKIVSSRQIALHIDAATPGGIGEPEPARFPWLGLFIVAAVCAAAAVGALA